MKAWFADLSRLAVFHRNAASWSLQCFLVVAASLGGKEKGASEGWKCSLLCFLLLIEQTSGRLLGFINHI